MQEKSGSSKPLKRVPDGVKVTQSGQIFTINNLEPSDKGRYSCKVQSTVLTIEQIYIVTYGSTQGNHSVLIVIIVYKSLIKSIEHSQSPVECKAKK